MMQRKREELGLEVRGEKERDWKVKKNTARRKNVKKYSNRRRRKWRK